MALSRTINPALNKKLVNFRPLTLEIMWLTFTHHRSTVRVLHMLVHLSALHVTLLQGEFQPPEFFPQSDLGHWADSHWALPQIYSFKSVDVAPNYTADPISE